MRKGWGRITGLALVASLAMLVAGERLASMVGWPQPSASLFAYDAKLGYRYPASTRIDFETSGIAYTVEFDRDGVADRWQGKGGLVYLLGDGLIAGLELPADKRLAYRLGEMTGKTVVNLAVTGYGAIQQERLLRGYFLQGNSPDHVVLVMNLDNDLIDNVREWDGAGLPSVSIHDDQQRIQEPQQHDWMFRVARNMMMKSRLYGKFRQLQSGNVVEVLPDPRTLALLDEWNSEQSEKAFSIMKNAIARVAHAAADRHANFVLILWIDPAIRASAPEKAVRDIADALVAGLPEDSVSVFVCDVCAVGKDYYVSGVRHFGSAATAELATYLSRIIGS